MTTAFQPPLPLLAANTRTALPVRTHAPLYRAPPAPPRAPLRATVAPTSSAADGEAPEYRLAPGEIAVRFINTPSGADVVAAAHVGDGLLNVGDSVGIHIPRACQSGLCGSCTCDVVDPASEDGRQTVRACQTGVVPVDGSAEIIIDVARMKTARSGADPMSRFENLDTDYVAGAAPRKSSGRGIVIDTMDCPECRATGEIECYECDGTGKSEAYGFAAFCVLCSGMKTLRCADCQGTGTVQVRR